MSLCPHNAVINLHLLSSDRHASVRYVLANHRELCLWLNTCVYRRFEVSCWHLMFVQYGDTTLPRHAETHKHSHTVVTTSGGSSTPFCGLSGGGGGCCYVAGQNGLQQKADVLVRAQSCRQRGLGDVVSGLLLIAPNPNKLNK
jgi:hypothetical protein